MKQHAIESTRLLELYRQPPIIPASIDGLAHALKLWGALVTQPFDDTAYTFSIDDDGVTIADEATGRTPFIDSGIYPAFETVADCALNFTIDGKPLADCLAWLQLYPDGDTPAPELYAQWHAANHKPQPPAAVWLFACDYCKQTMKRLAGAGTPHHCPYCYRGKMHAT